MVVSRDSIGIKKTISICKLMSVVLNVSGAVSVHRAPIMYPTWRICMPPIRVVSD